MCYFDFEKQVPVLSLPMMRMQAYFDMAKPLFLVKPPIRLNYWTHTLVFNTLDKRLNVQKRVGVIQTNNNLHSLLLPSSTIVRGKWTTRATIIVGIPCIVACQKKIFHVPDFDLILLHRYP